MPLNLPTGGGGEFTPYLKYNAKAGRWSIRAEDGESETEVQNPVLAFDMENIRTGWIQFKLQGPPERVWDSSRTVAAPQPITPGNWRRGFEVVVVGSRESGIGIREWSSNASSAIAAMHAIYSDWESARKSHQGQLPIFTCTGVKPVPGKHGVNYEPQFKLTGWVDRSRVPGLEEARRSNGAPPADIQPPMGNVPQSHKIETQDRSWGKIQTTVPSPARDPLAEDIPF